MGIRMRPPSGLIAGPVNLTSSFDIKAVANVATDVTGMSIAVPASLRPVWLRFKCECVGNPGTSTNDTILMAYVSICDASNNIKALSKAVFRSSGTGYADAQDLVVEVVLPAPVSAATYKVRAQTNIAIPANWSSMGINPSIGLAAAGAADALMAIAL